MNEIIHIKETSALMINDSLIEFNYRESYTPTTHESSVSVVD